MLRLPPECCGGSCLHSRRPARQRWCGPAAPTAASLASWWLRSPGASASAPTATGAATRRPAHAAGPSPWSTAAPAKAKRCAETAGTPTPPRGRRAPHAGSAAESTHAPVSGNRSAFAATATSSRAATVTAAAANVPCRSATETYAGCATAEYNPDAAAEAADATSGSARKPETGSPTCARPATGPPSGSAPVAVARGCAAMPAGQVHRSACAAWRCNASTRCSPRPTAPSTTPWRASEARSSPPGSPAACWGGWAAAPAHDYYGSWPLTSSSSAIRRWTRRRRPHR